ncbi:MAG TPA: hypothetical protein VF511_09705, partial [Chthoniobacterales bacterium]
MENPPPLPPRSIAWTIFLGTLVANAIGGVVLLPLVWVVSTFREPHPVTFVVWPSFFLLPLLVGMIAAWFWRRLNRSFGWTFLDALWVTLAGLAAAALVLREGIVCVVIGSPILYLFILTGVLIGRLWFRPNHSRLQLTIFPLLALLLLAEPVYHSEQPAVVTDRIVIRAPPAKVWP